MPREEGLRVVAAALLHEGVTYSLPPPARHFDVMRDTVKRLGLESMPYHEQGFLLSNGRFCRRKPAYIIAEKAGQLLPRQPGGYNGPELYSEDVW